MSHEDDSDPRARLTQELGKMAQAEEREAAEWWEAAQQGEPGRLPPGSPPVEELRPLDAGERAQLTASLFGAPPQAKAPPLKPPTPIPLWRSRGLWVPALSLALAAGLALLVLKTPEAPHYRLEANAGDQEVRGSASNASKLPEFQPGSRLEVVLKPESNAGPSVAVAVFLVSEGVSLDWPLPIERATSGAFRLVGTVGSELPLTPGEWRLIAYLGPQGELPSDVTQTPGAATQTLVHRFRVRPPDRATP